MALTHKNRRFVEEYLLDLDPRAAAVRAGYAPTVGYNLLYKAPIAEAVEAGMEARSKRTRVDSDRVIQTLAAIAFSDIREVVSWTATVPEGDCDGSESPTYRVRVRDSRDLDADTVAAISEMHRYSWGAVHVKLYDKLGALKLLGRHLGMFGGR